jgi:hypothetical protein
MRTDSVSIRTTMLLVRYRFSIDVKRGDKERRLLAETSGVLAFQGPPTAPEWLPAEGIRSLLSARPSGNVVGASESIHRIIDVFDETLAAHVAEDASWRAEALQAEYSEVRQAARAKGVTYRVTAHMPPDILGFYIFVPQTSG